MSLISNRKWFRTYTFIRQITLFGLLFCLFFGLIKSNNTEIWKAIMGICTMLLLLFTLFDYREKPSFFELEKKGDSLLLQLFLPDYRNLFFFREKYIVKTVIEKGTTVRLLKVASNFWESDKKYVLTLTNSAKNELFGTQVIVFSWADEATIQTILDMIARHNEG